MKINIWIELFKAYHKNFITNKLLTILPSTGLFDKNEKEIFLGDICRMVILDLESELVKIDPKPFLVVIEFKNAAFGYRHLYPELVHEDDRDWTSFWCPEDGEVWNPKYFEVIGNIYENEDLLHLED